MVNSYKQQGLTLISFFLICALVGFSALVVLKLFPLYNEAFRVSASLKTVATMPDIAMKNADDIKNLLMRNFEVQEVRRFDERNIKKYFKVEKEKGKKERTLHMQYESRGPLFGDLDLVLKFDKAVAIRESGSALE
ncbi:MAG: DUF4845 domain-containing protein [Gammaproteobacteria bacterium]